MNDAAIREFDLAFAGAEQRSRIVIARGAISQLRDHLDELRPGRAVAVICDDAISATIGASAITALQSADSTFNARLIPFNATEQTKSLATVRSLYDEFLRARLDRTSTVIAIGGGVTGDVAGFAAATYMRGVRFVNIPTTLLAMVDAAIGGKTAVNIDFPDRPGELGKNLIGAFHQPALVLIDPGALDTLPDRLFRAGLAECLKHAIIADPIMFGRLEQSGREFRRLAGEGDFTDFLERNIRIKAAIVAKDERESCERMKLNLGHTFAHAIETLPELDLLHGEAVALGLIASSAAAVALDRADPSLTGRIQRAVETIGLPSRLPVALSDAGALLDRMMRDKKSYDGTVRLVVPNGIGQVEIVDRTPSAAINDGWAAIAART